MDFKERLRTIRRRRNEVIQNMRDLVEEDWHFDETNAVRYHSLLAWYTLLLECFSELEDVTELEDELENDILK